MTALSVLVTVRHVTTRITAAPCLMLAALLLIAFRKPNILTVGRFWAEEGVVYFRDALLGSWFDALLAPRVGYYSAWNKLAALAATGVPLEAAPLVTAYAALAVQLTVVWIAVRSDAFPGHWGKMLAAAVVLFAMPGDEIWLNTINSQFYFALGAAMLLVTSPGPLSVPFRLGFLLLAGTTGPVTAFLAPFFLWRAVRQPTRLWWAEAVLVCLCAAGQGWLTLESLAAGTRPSAFDLRAFLAALGIKQLAFPFLGKWAFTAADALIAGSPAKQYQVTGVILVLGVLVVSVLLGHPRARQLGLAAVAVAALSVGGALGADAWVLVPPLSAHRYAFMPNAALGLGLVAVVMAPGVAGWRRAASAVLLTAFLVNGAGNWRSKVTFQRGPDWRASVAAWRADPTRQDLAIWPNGWVMTLPRSVAER